MLVELLRRVAQGGVHSTAILAREFGVDKALLAQMTDDLARMGYLRPLSNGCEQACRACPLTDGCCVEGMGHVWALTEKGLRVANAG